jgi:DNA repair protein RadC
MKVIHPQEFKIMSLRDCPVPSEMRVCETPQQAVDYWQLHIATTSHFNPECECMAALMLNTRRRVKGHQLLASGTMDTILVHPRDVFRCAIIAAAASVVIIHNHPSGVIPHPVLYRM